MKNYLSFSDFADDILSKFSQTGLESGLFSFCIQLPCRDLLDIYSLFIDQYKFSIFWEESNNTSYLVLDKCKSIIIEASNRFELAKNFNEENFKKIIQLDSQYKCSCGSKIFYFLSFANNINKKESPNNVPNLEGVLPKILITNDGDNIFMRMNVEIDLKTSIKDYIYEFWSVRSKIISEKNQKIDYKFNKISINNFYRTFNQSYELLNQNISKAIQLINDGSIDKLVLGYKLILKIKDSLNIIKILKRFKLYHPNSCRYVWKRNENDLIFGASPEKLFSYYDNKLILEAIAGTGLIGEDIDNSLKCEKNIREHNFVINYLIESLQLLNVNTFKKGKLSVKECGNIAHLCTLIHADMNKLCPFKLLDILHPSPAVCGYPKDESLRLISSLENFDRGNYASPIGWVDNQGNADFRVALRGARIINGYIEFIAGSGLVKGSVCEKEIQEIKLKLESIAIQIFDDYLVN